MNLKDAFRAQNKLQSLMDEASCILQDRDSILKVTTTHLRRQGQAAPGHGQRDWPRCHL